MGSNTVIINGAPVEFVQLEGLIYWRNNEDGTVERYNCLTSHLDDGGVKVSITDLVPEDERLVLAVEAALNLATGRPPNPRRRDSAVTIGGKRVRFEVIHGRQFYKGPDDERYRECRCLLHDHPTRPRVTISDAVHEDRRLELAVEQALMLARETAAI